jgi:hypothetical protein
MKRQDKSLVMTTKELREVAREAKRRNYNRNLTPAQFKLLDPKGTHIVTPRQIHHYAHEVPVDPHVRCYAFVALIGQRAKAVERYLDVPMEVIEPFYDPEELFDPEDPDVKKFLQEGQAKLEAMEAAEGDLPPNFEEVVEEINSAADEDRQYIEQAKENK